MAIKSFWSRLSLSFALWVLLSSSLLAMPNGFCNLIFPRSMPSSCLRIKSSKFPNLLSCHSVAIFSPSCRQIALRKTWTHLHIADIFHDSCKNLFTFLSLFELLGLKCYLRWHWKYPNAKENISVHVCARIVVSCIYLGSMPRSSFMPSETKAINSCTWAKSYERKSIVSQRSKFYVVVMLRACTNLDPLINQS